MSAAPPSRTISILIADDEEEQLELLEILLRGFPAIIQRATSSRDAVDLYVAGVPDLVVLDVDMGFPGGFWAAGEIKTKARESGRDVVVFMATGRKSVEDVQRARKLGADEYLVKPVDRETLLERIRKHFPKPA